MGRTVVAVFESAYVAKNAYSELHNLGCAKNYMAVCTDYIQGKTLNLTRAGSVHSEIVMDELRAGSAIGAGVGVCIGIAAGLLAGLGLINIPFLTWIGNGPLRLFLEIFGWIVIGLVAGSILGRLLSGLAGQGIPESELEQYARAVPRSNVTLLVVADKFAVDDIIAVLEKFNPLEIQQKPIGWKEIAGKGKKLAEPSPRVHSNR